MYHIFRQNNSGGSFVVNKMVNHFVVVEADNRDEANAIAEDIGIYFDGCEQGMDCECCGDRWYPCYSDDLMTQEQVKEHILMLVRDFNYTRDEFVFHGKAKMLPFAFIEGEVIE